MNLYYLTLFIITVIIFCLFLLFLRRRVVGGTKDIEKDLDTARELFRDRKFRAAEVILEGILSSYPEHKGAKDLLAKIRLTIDNEATSIASLTEQPTIEQIKAEKYYQSAQKYLMEKDLDKALSDIDKALSLHPLFIDAIKLKNAIEEQRANEFYYSANEYFRKGNIEKAKENALKALELVSDHESAKSLLEQIEEIIAITSTSDNKTVEPIEKSIQDKAERDYQFALKCKDEGKFEQAIKFLKQVIKNNPKHPDAQNLLFILETNEMLSYISNLQEKGDIEEAKELIDGLYNSHPNFQKIVSLKEKIDGQIDKINQIYLEAVKLASGGKLAEAGKKFEQILERCTHYKDTEEWLERLGKRKIQRVDSLKLISQFGEFILMGKKELKVGRRSDNDLVLQDVNVSRKHAVLHSIGSELLLEDLDSHNGTMVNSARLTTPVYIIKNNDVVNFGGNVEFKVNLFFSQDESMPYKKITTNKNLRSVKLWNSSICYILVINDIYIGGSDLYEIPGVESSLFGNSCGHIIFERGRFFIERISNDDEIIIDGKNVDRMKEISNGSNIMIGGVAFIVKFM